MSSLQTSIVQVEKEGSVLWHKGAVTHRLESEPRSGSNSKTGTLSCAHKTSRAAVLPPIVTAASFCCSELLRHGLVVPAARSSLLQHGGTA